MVVIDQELVLGSATDCHCFSAVDVFVLEEIPGEGEKIRALFVSE